MTGRALVTGARGFVGRKLTAHLEANGWEVCGCDVPADGMTDEVFPCDVRNPEEIERMLEWAGKITHVFHLAAVTFVPETVQDPSVAFEVNLQGTVSLLTALERVGSGRRFLFVSSSEVYGPPQRLPVTEHHPLNPMNPYAISKLAAEQYCRFVHASQGTDAICLRPFNHSGPGQSDRFALPSFARQIAEIEAGLAPPEIRVGNLAAARDFCHVADVVRAYDTVAQCGTPGEVYNVCSGMVHSLEAALETLLGMARVDVQVTVDRQRLRPIDVPEIRGSHDKLAEATGWRPEIPFETLLEQVLDSWREIVGTGA